MKKVIIRDTYNDTIFLSELDAKNPIFAKKAGKLVGMIVKEQPPWGWIVRIGGNQGAYGNFDTFLGIVFWLCDGGKPCKKVSEGLGRASQAQEMALCDNIMLKGTTTICGTYTAFIQPKSMPWPGSVKIYQGQWIWDVKQIGCWWSVGYVEVIGK